MGDVIEFKTRRKKISEPCLIYDFKVKTKEDQDFLLNNLDKIMVTLPTGYDDNLK